MERTMSANTTTKGFPGKPGELIVRALSTVQFATTQQLTQLLYAPASLTYVRHTLKSLREDHYVKSIDLPQTGANLPVHTLSSRGIALSQSLGYPEVYPYDGRDTLLFLPHQLAVTDLIVELTRWGRGSLKEIRHERILKRLGHPAVPDVWVRLQFPDGQEAAIWFEVERARKSQKQIRAKVRNILGFAQEGYSQAYDAKSLTIAVVCEHGDTQASSWVSAIEAEIASQHLEHASDLFRVSGHPTPGIFDHAWTRPIDRQRLPLVEE